jgi:hypothetical protein
VIAMKRIPILLLVLGVLSISLAVVPQTQARGDQLELTFLWPNEGETLYAGPTSLLYKVPVSGVVSLVDLEMDQVSVRLDIYQGIDLLGSLTAQPESDGTFEFYVTVNPAGSTEDFPTGLRYCEDCHSPGDAALAPGGLLLRLTASTPGGIEAVAERHVVVDLSGTALVPVRVAMADDPARVVDGVYVAGTARLYQWRTRSGKGITDSSGLAMVRVEALSQASTKYVFYIEPTIVDGALYEGLDSVEVVLPAGAVAAETVTLFVKRTSGSLSGSISSPGSSPFPELQLWAVQVPTGQAWSTPVLPSGDFDFDTLPIAQYWLATDIRALASRGFRLEEKMVDLEPSGAAVVNAYIQPIRGGSLFGAVQEQAGDPLPFAWVGIEDRDAVAGVLPEDGSFVLEEILAEKVTLVASAPGYYSQIKTYTLASDSLPELDFRLRRRPETQSLPWGDGSIVLPPETDASVTGDLIALSRGWLWGEGHTTQPITVQVGSFEIELSSGRFALENVPNHTPWLYVIDGEFLVRPAGQLPSLLVGAGQMLALIEDTPLIAVPMDPVVVNVYHQESPLPITIIWEPTLGERIGQSLERVGVGTAKIVTFVTYMIIFLSILLLPVSGVYWWLKRKRASKK